MKNFGKYLLASILGTLITGLLGFFLLFIFFASLIAMSSEPETIIKQNSVLHLTLDKPIQERGQDSPFPDDFQLNGLKNAIGLNDIIEKIEGAAKDDRIKGIWLDINSVSSGMAILKEVRNTLEEFKKSGKFVIAYSSYYSQGAYYLASVADEIWVNPEGSIDFRGLSAQLMFFKTFLEKMDINMQVIRHGKYKSAVEPFLLDHMSEANQEQTSKFLGSLWGSLLKDVSASRNLSIAQLNEAADKISLENPQKAKELGFIDKLAYRDEILAYLKEKSENTEQKKLETISLSKYKAPKDKNKKGERIAVVYAAGNIVDGDGEKNEIGGDKYAKILRKLRLDDKVKAVVLRVNSPGGSALASEIIWREIVLTRKVKPVIVSMSDLAASGGYYIACAADYIFADPTTITGSIGVFGVVPDISKLLSDKIGINVDMVNTNKNAGMGTILRPLTPYQHNVIQNSVERIYDVFTKRVADGRNLRQTYVDSIGQGRVWSGVDALEIGLVDKMGGIEDAIAMAAEKANLDSYKTKSFPKQLDFFESLMEEIYSIEETSMKNRLGKAYFFLNSANETMKMKGVQARLPFVMVVE